MVGIFGKSENQQLTYFQTVSSELDSDVELLQDCKCSCVIQNASLHNLDVDALTAGCQGNLTLFIVNTKNSSCKKFKTIF